ncbi:hypothetical protein A2662_00485 [Candidatus Giovannonibacteria bacterium RIFCSPHIGHO2_01_FULL_45_33]|uniref:Uncharacterized protein n=1 Tax=Candidatus Giovannonibacteria bacterium RIFCSPLOWO2_01_FULL_45_34 TaxID=1798351 RepID=A0A1F5WYQ0_9BACT|nr:MAG: hypothetical protein A2662_00485 [Candidatus Giovannonibacteria bacterium RIFCSPHIGHO2_01_FULL_45_33]OGF69787.1 MAG: hypothetical protein A3C73_03350 [Candidatus Giovannonibacteria bacterium RIFCSPHIGHO2_02_FULL_44_11]OGF80758.1 MAG: hypothetical protein A2930_02420 [Candidatus Giovannonibacteria bacterium RIFCSPLOWO2_01_FULL_45_34]
MYEPGAGAVGSTAIHLFPVPQESAPANAAMVAAYEPLFESKYNSFANLIWFRSAIRLASRDFFLAVFNEANTIEAKMPIMAITTKSSIRVKPLPPPFFLFKSFNIFFVFLY